MIYPRLWVGDKCRCLLLSEKVNDRNRQSHAENGKCYWSADLILFCFLMSVM